MKAIVAFIAVIVILIVGIAYLFTRDPAEQVSSPAQERIDLTEYVAEPSTVSYLIEGELNAEEEHRAIRISISRNMRSIDVLSGYSGTILRSNSFPNTQAAYEEFMFALENAGFTNEQESRYASEKGVCPLGRRYIYRIDGLGEEISRLWSTSCNSKDGSFGGNSNLVRQLFQNQIPEYRQLTRGIRL